jgi:hypothetical protein
VIPKGRPVINEAAVAQRVGTPLATWRRRDAGAFRERVPSLFPDSRYLIYDLAQADAYLAGRTIRALPTDEHPDDLLNDKEAGAVLGITPSTVRAYAAQGYLSRGKNVYGARVWPRHEIEHRRDNPLGQGKGGGRRAGEPQGSRKAHAYEGDARLIIAREALVVAGPSTPKGRIAAELATQHGATVRTWERLLTAAASETAPEA